MWVECQITRSTLSTFLSWTMNLCNALVGGQSGEWRSRKSKKCGGRGGCCHGMFDVQCSNSLRAFRSVLNDSAETIFATKRERVQSIDREKTFQKPNMNTVFTLAVWGGRCASRGEEHNISSTVPFCGWDFSEVSGCAIRQSGCPPEAWKTVD